MAGQQKDQRDSSSSYWFTDSDLEDSDSYSDSSSGSYPDPDLYSDVYFKEEETPTRFPDKMNEEVSDRMNIFQTTISINGKISPSTNGIVCTEATKRENSPEKASNVSALTVTIPSLTVVFALLLVASLILLWKKTVKRKSLKQVSKPSHNIAKIQGADEGTKNPGEHHSIELSRCSLEHHFSGGIGKAEEGAIAKGNASIEDAEYLEIDEYVNQMYQRTILKVDSYQTGTEYMDLGSNSGNTSVYEKLNNQRRYEVDNIGPSDKKDTQPQ